MRARAGQAWRKSEVSAGTQFFAMLEKASDDDIDLLEFQPDKASRELTLRGDARNLDALIAYMNKLAEQPGVSGAYLVHQKQRQREMVNVVNFELHLTMVP